MNEFFVEQIGVLGFRRVVDGMEYGILYCTEFYIWV